MKKAAGIILVLFCISLGQLCGQIEVTSYDELLNLVSPRSLTLKNGEIKLDQAKKAKLAAIYGLFDPAGELAGSYTNNTKLPVTLLPSEMVGGEPGNVEEIVFGLPYMTNYGIYGEIKLLNLQGWGKLKQARLSVQIQETENQLSLQEFKEQIATLYFSIVSLQEQLKAARFNLAAADTLYRVTQTRFENSQTNQQDVHAGRINLHNAEETIRQIKYQISLQELALKVLCDLPEDEVFRIQQRVDISKEFLPVPIENNQVRTRQAALLESSYKSGYRQSLSALAPTLSIFASNQNQQYKTSPGLTDPSEPWYNSNYVGVKLRLPIPSQHVIEQSTRARQEYLLARNNKERVLNEAAIAAKQMAVEYDKAVSQFKRNKEIYELRKESYQMNLKNYEEGIMSVELLSTASLPWPMQNTI